MDETRIDTLTIEIGASSDKAVQQINAIVDALRRLRGKTSHTIKVDTKEVDKAHKKVSALGNLLNSLKRIAFYRVIRSAIKAIGEAFSQGAENAYWYSKTIGDQTKYIAEAYDTLSSKSFTMSNQLGAAWATLKAAIAPVLIEIINLVTSAANAITQFFAVLGGHGNYLKAIDYSKEWADTTKKGAGAAKEWKNQLMGFDEINRLEEPSKGGGGSALPDYENMFKEADVDGVFAKIKAKFDELKESLDFSNLLEAWNKLKISVNGFADIVGDSLGWAWDNILVPLATWTVEEALPVVIETLANAFDFFRTVLELLQPAFQWVWDNIFSPLAEWTGEVVINALQGLSDLLHDITDLLNGNTTFKDFIDDLSPWEEVLLAIGSAIGIVTAALGVYNAITAIATAVTGGFSAVLSFLAANPVVLIIAAITAIIVVVIELIKHWDEVKATAIRVWDAICKAVSSAWEWITDVFSKVGDFFEGVWEGIGTTAKSAFNVVIGFVERFINSIISGINTILSGISSVASAVASVFGGSSIYLSIGYVSLPRFATGGFPEDGLFLANHNELVGKFSNGQTAVANNEQIIEGIRQGVYEAVTAAMSGGSNDVSVKVYLDSREIKAGQERLARAWG